MVGVVVLVEHGSMLLSAVLGLIVPGLELGCLWRHFRPPARRRIALLVPGMIDCTCARWRLREIGDEVGILLRVDLGIWRQMRSAGNVYLRVCCPSCCEALPACLT